MLLNGFYGKKPSTLLQRAMAMNGCFGLVKTFSEQIGWGWYRLFPLSDACVYVKEWDLNESRASCMPSVHKGVQNQIDTHAMQAKPVVGPFLNTFYCCHKFRNCSTKNFSVDWSWFHRFLFQFSIFQDGKWKRQLKICQGGTWILDHHFRLHNSWIFKHCKIF